MPVVTPCLAQTASNALLNRSEVKLGRPWTSAHSFLTCSGVRKDTDLQPGHLSLSAGSAAGAWKWHQDASLQRKVLRSCQLTRVPPPTVDPAMIATPVQHCMVSDCCSSVITACASYFPGLAVELAQCCNPSRNSAHIVLL